jgi:hypothetical protein
MAVAMIATTMVALTAAVAEPKLNRRVELHQDHGRSRDGCRCIALVHRGSGVAGGDQTRIGAQPRQMAFCIKPIAAKHVKYGLFSISRTQHFFGALMCCAAGTAVAACPPAPADFTEPAAIHQSLDLARELEAPWQAGGKIVLICAPGGAPKVGRLAQPPRNQAAEQARRVEHFAIAQRINLARKGEVHPLGLALATPQLELLESFALSDAGAPWLRAITDDTLRLFNWGYLEYDAAVWRRGVKQGRLPALSELLTGRLTETAQFADDADIFKFTGYAGHGAMAHPGAVGLGDAGLRERFPASNERVDPFAIISHELGHTRYGDPTSAGSLEGEANTVTRYENPVRIRNGYPPRALYFVSLHPGVEAPLKRGYMERMLTVKQMKGISVNELTAFDRYRIGPMPIMLDCAVRARPAPEAHRAGLNSDCKLNWKPGTLLTSVLAFSELFDIEHCCL